MTGQQTGKGRNTASLDRSERLEAQLRENLKRRKELARARAARAAAPAQPEAGDTQRE